jgi:hypothetical protein
MRIAIVGGVERAEPELARIANELGHDLEYHPGHMGGRGSNGLRRMIERCELVLIVTEVNSHGAVQVAKREARASGRPVRIVRKCGAAFFRELATSLPRAS